MGQVKLCGVRKSYGDHIAVVGIDLDIVAGEFVVLLGPSGCGKSTLLRLIAGLEDLTAGELIINDRVCNDILPQDRDVAMVFQSYALFPHLTVAQNIGYGLRVRGGRSSEQIAEAVRAMAILLDLQSVLNNRPEQLSGGQRQRVAMSRAMIRDPSLFLFDEPLSNLDAQLRTQLRVEIKRIHRRLGKTTIFVTHDQSEAMTLADRIVVMRAGKVEQIGVPLRIYDYPDNLFVAKFLGTPQMNRIPLRRDNDRLLLANGKDAAQIKIVATAGSCVPLPTLLRAHNEVELPAKMILGVRPEAVLLRPTEDGWTLDLELIERTGPRTYFYLSDGGASLCGVTVLRLEENGARKFSVGFAGTGTHLFGDDGQRLKIDFST